jgi:glycosyltransferase involved in cell wall biosynthesis
VDSASIAADALAVHEITRQTVQHITIVAPQVTKSGGGQALHAADLSQHLRREGYSVQLLPIDPDFPTGAGWVRRAPYLRTILNQCLYLPSLWALRRSDIVHVSSASYWSFLLAPLPAMIMGRLFGKPVILNYHSGEAADHLARWGVLVHPWLSLADQIVVPSEYLRHVFASHGYGTRVIHNTVDTSRFPYRVRDPLRPRLLSTRSFEWYYGVDQTLRAFKLIQHAYPDATLEIAGAGSCERELRALARSLSLTGVRFLGPVAPSDVPSLHERADILVNSSLIDNQPLSILEAMASGMPVVSTGTGDIVNMIEHGISGTIVPQKDPAAMAAAVIFLLKYPDGARAMASRAVERLRRYSWKRVASQWSGLYAEMLQQRPSERPGGIRDAA